MSSGTTCVACAANCNSCTVAGQCTSGQCATGYKDGTSNNCVACSSNCNACTITGQCTSGQCRTGYATKVTTTCTGLFFNKNLLIKIINNIVINLNIYCILNINKSLYFTQLVLETAIRVL